MSYEATYEVKITIKDGPPVVQEKRVVSDIITTSANRISFKACSTAMYAEINASESSDKAYHKALCRRLQFALGDVSEKKHLAFVAIKATKYSFKRCVNQDAGGIGYKLLNECKTDCKGETPIETTCGSVEWLTGERVIMNVCGALNAAKEIQIYVDEKLFDCSKKEADEIVITVTYGVAGDVSQIAESDGTIDCCPKPDKLSESQLGNRRFQMA